MLSVCVLAALAIAASMWRLRLFITARKTPGGLKDLPGPKGYPIIGSILEFPKTFSYHKFKDWSDKYGPIFQVKILGTTHVVISDVEIANDLLALRGSCYSDRPRIVMLHELVSRYGNLGSSPQNEYWKNGRKFSSTTLSSNALEQWSAVQVNQAARLVYDLVSDVSKYEYLFERYSATVALRVLYNKSLSRWEEKEHLDKIAAIVRTLERTGAPGAYLVDFMPLLKYLPSWLAPFKAEANRLHEFEYSYFRNLLVEGQQHFRSENDNAKRPQALIQAYVSNKGSWNLSDFEIAYVMGTLLEGGSGTTSSAMQSYCLAMWHYPDWQKKVQDEIDRVVGDRLPSFDDWPDLPTVRAVMKETIRWRPVVPGGIPHRATKDDTYNGFFIPEGATVHANQYAMFKNEATYPDAEAFNPERWLNPNYPTYQEPLTQYPNLKRFPAFGFGRRICPGLVLAERSLFIEISMLMWLCSVRKKVDEEGQVIPVPWYDYKPGNNTGPNRFDFEVEVRDEQRLQILTNVVGIS
ncbi:uncharacterized protein A1O5_06089 [Cladophialophora psammophila CBS 110553]|uniref:Cytochrome P450 oxidoreductase n=1 Tax=Cladophialophora psammophila CBS 110553 TaxID=1182543 RepID=W9X2D2_9EURO|nr:uncharacterized protein A1O5_06089 [Cladophialophora psammophila CBS 110553]EXJ71096.1 hypothetical protein A1O5_06089 [Cladophialophora psammophila CBS 110553]